MPLKIVITLNSDSLVSCVRLVARDYRVSSAHSEKEILPGRYLIEDCSEEGFDIQVAFEDTPYWHGFQFLLPINRKGEVQES